MKIIFILMFFLITVQLVQAAQDPGYVFCELQGFHQRLSTILQVDDNEIQFIHNFIDDGSLFCLSFDNGTSSTYGCKFVIDILGAGLEKEVFIKNIFEEKGFGKYTVKKIDKRGYGPWFEIFGPYKEITICDFSGGHNCPSDDFLQGKCGKEYIKELPCVGEGESIRQMFQECCEGLKVYNPRPDCEGCLPICKPPPTKMFIIFWEWIKSIF